MEGSGVPNLLLGARLILFPIKKATYTCLKPITLSGVTSVGS